MAKPVCIDLFCGLGGWTEAFLAEGYECIGFDIEAHDYGAGGYPGRLVLRDIRSIHGSEFKNAAIIVASPPCQAYSYRAMPWSRAKALPPPDNTLFDACFRIQREACEAAGRYIPMIVENVRGAVPWVGPARWHYGSFYLWGDVPALMPITFTATKTQGIINIRDGYTHTRHLTNQRESEGVKAACGVPVAKGDFAWNKNAELQAARRESGTKQAGIGGVRKNGKGDRWFQDGATRHGSKSNSRKAASAMIAKIPYPLAQHIARCYYPRPAELQVVHG
jgi:hypothetical protein